MFPTIAIWFMLCKSSIRKIIGPRLPLLQLTPKKTKNNSILNPISLCHKIYGFLFLHQYYVSVFVRNVRVKKALGVLWLLSEYTTQIYIFHLFSGPNVDVAYFIKKNYTFDFFWSISKQKQSLHESDPNFPTRVGFAKGWGVKRKPDGSSVKSRGVQF